MVLDDDVSPLVVLLVFEKLTLVVVLEDQLLGNLDDLVEGVKTDEPLGKFLDELLVQVQGRLLDLDGDVVVPNELEHLLLQGHF